MTLNKIYAGIGSRETPSNILSFIGKVSYLLAMKGFILRSGGARGADTAFIEGTYSARKPRRCEVYVASEKDGTKWDNVANTVIAEIPSKAFDIASEHHPKFDLLSEYVKRLMARNVMQILGRSLDSAVDFVICYTHDGKDSGGTGQAIRVANTYDVPVFNLYNLEDYNSVKQIIK